MPWHILAPRRGCFSNHLPLRRVRILAERFHRIETKFPIRQKTALAIHRTAGRSCFPIFLYKHCRNQKPPTLISLFFLYIFQTVKGYGCQDDDTFKYELKVCINTKNRQRVGQSGERSIHPTTTPEILPIPPVKDTPPTTQAAMASISQPCP